MTQTSTPSGEDWPDINCSLSHHPHGNQLTCSAQFRVAEAEFAHVLLVPPTVRGEELVSALSPEGVDGAGTEEDTSYSAGDRPGDTNCLSDVRGRGGEGMVEG